MTVSIVINNYNYAEFVERAVRSALAQTYTPVEVIVVDDGSTDESLDILANFADQVDIIAKPNGGQASAMNAGYAASQGDIVVFLDADDELRPEAVGCVVDAWTPDCAKVQYRLSIVDRYGARLGVDPPTRIRLPNGDVVPQIAATGGYVSPVTTGNAFRRSVLDQLLPIPEREFRISADGYLNALAPFFGPVRSIDAELGCWRHHGHNRWALGHNVSLERLRAQIAHDLERDALVMQLAARRRRPMPENLSLRSASHCLARLASLKLDPARHAVPADTLWALTRAGLAATWHSHELGGATERSFHAGATVAIAVLPAAAARRTVAMAFAGPARPKWLKAAGQRLRGLKQLRRRADRSAAG